MQSRASTWLVICPEGTWPAIALEGQWRIVDSLEPSRGWRRWLPTHVGRQRIARRSDGWILVITGPGLGPVRRWFESILQRVVGCPWQASLAAVVCQREAKAHQLTWPRVPLLLPDNIPIMPCESQGVSECNWRLVRGAQDLENTDNGYSGASRHSAAVPLNWESRCETMEIAWKTCALSWP